MVFAKAARRGGVQVLIKVSFSDQIPWQLAVEDQAVDVRLLDYVRGTMRSEYDQGTPTQSLISPSTLVYEENCFGS